VIVCGELNRSVSRLEPTDSCFANSTAKVWDIVCIDRKILFEQSRQQQVKPCVEGTYIWPDDRPTVGKYRCQKP
jgi:hypothetical protein